MPFETRVNSLFIDIWRYLVISCFDWKNRVFQKAVVKVYYILKTGYYLEILTTETMKLLGSIENKINKDENGEIVPQIEITEVMPIH